MSAPQENIDSTENRIDYLTQKPPKTPEEAREKLEQTERLQTDLEQCNSAVLKEKAEKHYGEEMCEHLNRHIEQSQKHLDSLEERFALMEFLQEEQKTVEDIFQHLHTEITPNDSEYIDWHKGMYLMNIVNIRKDRDRLRMISQRFSEGDPRKTLLQELDSELQAYEQLQPERVEQFEYSSKLENDPYNRGLQKILRALMILASTFTAIIYGSMDIANKRLSLPTVLAGGVSLFSIKPDIFFGEKLQQDAKEILTVIYSLKTLRKKYGIRGKQWANLAEDIMTNPERFKDDFQNKRFDELIALLPKEATTERSALKAMLEDSKEGGQDFLRLIDALAKAKNDETKQSVRDWIDPMDIEDSIRR